MTVPLIFKIEVSGPGAPCCCALNSIRRLVIFIASRSTSAWAIRAANSGSSIRRLPPRRILRASAFTSSSDCMEKPTPAMPVRSWVSRNLAMVQPLFSSPTRFSAGTRTSVKNTSFTSWPPSIRRIGRTSMPGVFISTRIKLMPCCCLASGSVRHRQKILSACCPRVVQVFWPLITQ